MIQFNFECLQILYIRLPLSSFIIYSIYDRCIDYVTKHKKKIRSGKSQVKLRNKQSPAYQRVVKYCFMIILTNSPLVFIISTKEHKISPTNKKI